MTETRLDYRRILKEFRFSSALGFDKQTSAKLLAAVGRLPASPRSIAGLSEPRLVKYLEVRQAGFKKHIGRFYQQRRLELVRKNLKTSHSYRILFSHSRLLDAVQIAAFNAATEDLPLLVSLLAMRGQADLKGRRAQLEKKLPGTAERDSNKNGPSGGGADDAEMSEQERAYHASLAAALVKEIVDAEAEIARLEACLPTWRGYRVKPRALLKRVVMFARGGYGRAEVSFSSDMDTGYCVDTQKFMPGELEIFQQLVIRTETLLKACGLVSAHQYFEINEDLSRFTAPETIHTIPSILESRPILGNARLLQRLQDSFKAILPYEEFLRVKVGEYNQQPLPSLTEMDLKEDRGGLRSIQIPLWILGVTHGAKSFMSADLIELAREKKLLSIWEATRYLLALELLNELRNFLGLAESTYYDQEARAGNFNIDEFPPNRINDALARLYVFRKRRFTTLDALDSMRLRLTADVARISDALLERVLDRTVTHSIEGIAYSVHLGRKQIIRIGGRKGRKAGRPARLFANGSALLGLIGFIAQSGYELSGALKDELSDTLRVVARPPLVREKARRAERFNEIMAAPHAHLAVAAMFEISDPLSSEMGTLLGAFIPEFDKILYLVRAGGARNMPAHEQIISSLENGQKSLEWLGEHYYELHALIGEPQRVALRWSLLLYGLGKIEGSSANPAHTAEQAVEVLDRLGCLGGDLERHVRLLVQHHQTIAGLSRTATYFDQALVEYFEVAGRKIVDVVLVFLVNRAILMAAGHGGGELENLNRFFEETSRILAAAQGVPEKSRSLEIINNYLYEKKEELQAETRAYQLLNKSVAVGLEEAVFKPLKKHDRAKWERLMVSAERIGILHKSLVLGQQSEGEKERIGARLVREIRNAVGEEGISALTEADRKVFTWFFCAFPNRYLLSSMPGRLAGQLGKFAGFERAKVLVDVVGGGAQQGWGLLISTRELEQSHSRVAYMLSRKRMNIISGKVNRVELGAGRHGYCYYFQISDGIEDTPIYPKELEGMILGETPPELEAAPLTSSHLIRGRRVEFVGNDGKGYAIKRAGGEFVRENSPFCVVRIVLRDEPFLFYKVARAFDLYGVEVRQSLITTTGNQVVDYFYLDPEDYERLRASSFQERFGAMMQVGLI